MQKFIVRVFLHLGLYIFENEMITEPGQHGAVFGYALLP